MLTTYHEVAHVSRPKNRRRRAEQRRGDIDAERLGGLQVDARPGAIRLDVSVGSLSDMAARSLNVCFTARSRHRRRGPQLRRHLHRPGLAETEVYCRDY